MEVKFGIFLIVKMIFFVFYKKLIKIKKFSFLMKKNLNLKKMSILIKFNDIMMKFLLIKIINRYQ